MLITLVLNGGKANQLFQHGAVTAIIKNHNLENVSIVCDVSQLGRHATPRTFELPNSISTTVGYNLFAPKFTEGQFNYTDKLEKFILDHYNKKTSQITVEGYFISYKYLNVPVLGIKHRRAVMHIRLKDYLNPHVADYHGILPLSYYQQALSKIPKDVTIFACSDDNELAYERIVKHLDRKVEMHIGSLDPILLMATSSHLIIANSSYSLLAAYRNDCADTVICPSRFFKKEMPEQDLLKDNWIKIPVDYTIKS